MPISDVAEQANLARFARLIARPDPAIDLALGALCAASASRPGVDFESCLAGLDSLAERVRMRIDLGDGMDTVIQRLHEVLYAQSGFRGPTAAEFGDPRSSQLDAVLDRRVGLPLTLAIVELEVGWRLGVPLHGVGLPGHFLVGAPGGVVMDPTDAGRSLTPDDCQALLRATVDERVLFHAAMLRPVGRREILARLLRNLRSAYVAGRQWLAAYRVVELLSIVEPDAPEHLRDRGILLGRLGMFSDALRNLGRYVDERPAAADVDDVRRVMSVFGGRRN